MDPPLEVLVDPAYKNKGLSMNLLRKGLKNAKIRLISIDLFIKIIKVNLFHYEQL